MSAIALALAIMAASPDLQAIPVLRQSRNAWEVTKRENGLPRDAIGWWDRDSNVIVILSPHPEERATILHERAHVEYAAVLDTVDRETWEKGWRVWGARLPWEPARKRAAEAYAYLSEWLSPESEYVGSVPVEAVRLLLRLRGRER